MNAKVHGNSVLGTMREHVIIFEWREGGIGACQLAGDSCILGEDVIIWSRKREDTNMIKAVIFDMDGSSLTVKEFI